MRVSGFWCTEGLSIHGKLAQGLPFKTEGGICALNRIGFGVGNAFPYRVMGVAFRAAFRPFPCFGVVSKAGNAARIIREAIPQK